MSMFRRRLLIQNALKQQGGVELPDGYIKIEWIETKVGVKYAVDLNHKVSELTEISLIIEQTHPEGRTLFTVAKGSANNMFGIYLHSEVEFQAQIKEKWQNIHLKTTLLHEKKEFTLNSKGCYLDNVRYWNPGNIQSFTGESITLFKDVRYGKNSPALVRVYGLKIKEGNKLVCECIPAKNQAGDVGLYDIIRNIFFKNEYPDVQFTAGEYIKFEDPEVAKICVQNFSSDGIGVTYADAEKVTNIGNLFQAAPIKIFNEFQYFTGVKKISDYQGFISNKTITEITYPKSLKEVGNATFKDCIQLEKINNIEVLEDVGQGAFGGYEEKRLGTNQSLNLPSLSFIGTNAFYGTKYESLKLGKLASIPNGNYEGSFGNMKQLKMVDLPNTLKGIGNYAFFNDISLNTLVIRAITPPTLSNTALDRCPISDIYVPDESVEAYKTASNWSNYASKIKPLSSYVEPTK